MLMFENLRSHSTSLELEDSIVSNPAIDMFATSFDVTQTLQSCLKDRCCEICAGEDREDITEDKMLFCDNCHVSRHASCYKVKIIPEGIFVSFLMPEVMKEFPLMRM